MKSLFEAKLQYYKLFYVNLVIILHKTTERKGLSVYFVGIMIDLSVEITEAKWKRLQEALFANFQKNIDINAALFLIGVQELGKGFENFSKEQKQDLMHIANCRVLSHSGYYKLAGKDNDGWPHWEKIREVPSLTLEEQDLFLKHHIIIYFSDIYEL